MQTSVDTCICKNENLDPEMCLRRGVCLVADQGGSDKVAQCKIVLQTVAVVSVADYGPRGPWFETWPGRRSLRP